MSRKQQILELIEKLPDEVSIERAIEELYLLQKIQVGLEQADSGDVVPHDEVKRQFLSKKPLQ